MCAAKMEPAVLGNVFLGDGGKYRRPRFRGQQVIARRLQLVRLDVESHRHQLPPRVQQESEIHLVRQPSGVRGGGLQIRNQPQRIAADFGKHEQQALVERSILILLMGRLSELLLQGVEERGQQLQRNLLSEHRAERGVAAQRREFRQPPRSIRAHQILNVPNPRPSLVPEPVGIGGPLGRQASLHLSQGRVGQGEDGL